MPKSWFNRITPEILAKAGPSKERLLVDREDEHKVAGPASAKAEILGRTSTQDKYALAEVQRKLR